MMVHLQKKIYLNIQTFLKSTDTLASFIYWLTTMTFSVNDSTSNESFYYNLFQYICGFKISFIA